MQRHRSNAFTLIEVISVVAILALLMTIAAYGFNKVIGGSKQRATEVTMGNLRSMLTEYEVVSKGLTRQPARMWVGGATVTLAGTYNIWRDGDADTALPEPDPIPTPGDVTTAAGTGANGRYSADGIANTQLVLGMLQQIPAVKTAMAQIPSSQYMETIQAGHGGVKLTVTEPSGYGNGNNKPAPPLVLDGWGNPILFVPSGGIYDLTVGDVKRKQQPTTLTPPSNDGPIKSPDARPFWASAGPDGDFSKGDDNIYSFEQQ